MSDLLFFLTLGSVIGGFGTIAVVGSSLEPWQNLGAFFAGAVLTFVVITVLLYGRSS